MADEFRQSTFDLQRFVDAQAAVYPTVIEELRAGTKRSHWMWFVFPQIIGLGVSEISRRFALRSLPEANAYAAHPVLGQRLTECTQLVLAARPTSPAEMFGSPDDLKFHSCMTLFSLTEPHRALFDDALAAFWSERLDEATVAMVRADPRHP